MLVLTRSGTGREGDIVGEKLAILHNKMGVGCRIVEIPVHNCGENSRIWKRMAGDRDSGRRLAIGVIGRK